MTRRLIAGIMGSHEHEWPDYAEPVGRLAAVSGFHLLTGGGRGVMTSAARAFCAVQERQGLSIGIVPTEPDGQGGFWPSNSASRLCCSAPKWHLRDSRQAWIARIRWPRLSGF